jgi:hypothetical protein
MSKTSVLLFPCAHCELETRKGPACEHCGADRTFRFTDEDRAAAARWTEHPEAMEHLRKIGANP